MSATNSHPKWKPIPKPKETTREGPVGVEIVRRRDGAVFVNVFHNNIPHTSLPMDENLTMPEALVLVAALIRMEHLT